MKLLIKYVSIGLLYSMASEVVNQIYIHQNPRGLVGTGISYLIFLPVMFFLWRGLRKVNPLFSVILLYIVSGAFGLWVEWTYLGNAGQNFIVQIAMATFWISFVLVPIIWLDPNTPPKLLRRLKIYTFVWIVLMLIPGAIGAEPGRGISTMAFVFGTLFLQVFMLRYIAYLFYTHPNLNLNRS